MELPSKYDELSWQERREVRNKYVELQDGNCFYCNSDLGSNPPENITQKPINWNLFPPHFLKHLIHLQHSHVTGFTEGAVHAYCNAVMWQYEGQ